MYITSISARRQATPQVKRRYDLGCTERLCRPVTSFAAKDGGRRAFFRKLIGNEQQERAVVRESGGDGGDATPAVKKSYESMVLVMWAWATPTATWTQTRRTCLGRHHHCRRKDGMETPSSSTSDDTCVYFSSSVFSDYRGYLFVAGSTPDSNYLL
ncbi:unnamed protein product [Pylaiella littoralis]